MTRLETSTTSVNAAWQYLLENSVSFDSPVNEFPSHVLQRANFKRKPPIETKVKIVNTLKVSKKTKNFINEMKEKISILLGKSF